MTNYNRISSIDIMRGIVIFLMLFLNYPGLESVPAWTGPETGQVIPDGSHCWLFAGFLFLAGMSIPFAFSVRFSRGDNLTVISRHIFIRFIGLLIIGILILNILRVNSEFTRMSGKLWAVAVFAGIFLVWNDYRDKDNNFFTVTGLRLIGMAILAFLVFRFKSGQPENEGSLITGWWGFAGLIGWGYMLTAFIYLFFRNSTGIIVLLTLVCLALNILTDLNLIILPAVAGSLAGVIAGQVPFITLTGLITGIIIKSSAVNEYGRTLLIFSLMMIVFLGAGISLIFLNILPVDDGTAGITLVSAGLCLLLFIPVYIISDVKKLTGWADFMRPAGENPLTAYLGPLFLYHLISVSGIPLLFFKQSENPVIFFGGSFIWALLMMFLTAMLVRLSVRLRI